MNRLLVPLLICFLSLSSALSKDKPNVLFLVVDDLNTWLLEDPTRYTGKVVAPNIQKFAKSGVLFERAYCASPVCSPSRTALFSGVSPWKSGHSHNALNLEKSEAIQEATSLAALFRQAGYYTSKSGKITHGWDQKEAWEHIFPHRRDPAPPGAPLTKVGRGEQDWGVTHLEEEEMHDTLIADSAIAELEKKDDRPFFIACGLFHPHMPWYVPEKYFDLFPLEEVKLPETLEGDLDDVPPLGQNMTSGKSKFVDSVKAAGLHQEAVQAYLATTAYSDAQMGRVLDALDASPYRDNTIVLLMSDHGFHLGEKNHWQKATLWEEATHCLLMMRVPGLTKAGQISPRFVSLQDIYPTLTELCGLETPDYVDGRSLVPLLKQPDAKWKSTAITALTDKSSPTEHFLTIRTEEFRYIRYSDEEEELYQVSSDPHEWENLATDPAYEAKLKAARKLLPDRSEIFAPLPRVRR